MPYPPKLVLELPLSDEKLLASFVEDCLRDGVSLIAIVGEGASRVDDLIDELVVGDGSDPDRYVTTSMHADESVEQVVEFAKSWEAELGQAIQRVNL